MSNPRRPDLSEITVEALADTGAVYLIIPEAVQEVLELEEQEKQQVTLADGSQKTVPYVGPVMTRFKNRAAFVGAIVMGNEVLLGAIPMENMDLVLLPTAAKSTSIPNIPTSPRPTRNNFTSGDSKSPWMPTTGRTSLTSHPTSV